MKHGIALRKLSRPTAHRMLMLRNMVTSLLEHEQIKTTLPKAREAARLAEKIITMGKKGDRGAENRASAFILKQELIPKIFTTLAHRYANRSGGYTRIHKFGNRPGDNAETAILELVDNPRDLRYEMTARSVGRELLEHQLRVRTPQEIVNQGYEATHKIVDRERKVGIKEIGLLRTMTRWNLQKVLRFRDQAAVLDISQRIGHYIDHLIATPTVSEESLRGKPKIEPVQRVGHVNPGESRGVLELAQGRGGHCRPPPKRPVLDSSSVFEN